MRVVPLVVVPATVRKRFMAFYAMGPQGGRGASTGLGMVS